MPEQRIVIGGREFEVACPPGEEAFLQQAARIFDAEAQALLAQLGRLTTERMLLMAGLVLADKLAALEERVAEAEATVAALRNELERLRARPPERVEVPVVPSAEVAALAELAARAEALAAELASRTLAGSRP